MNTKTIDKFLNCSFWASAGDLNVKEAIERSEGNIHACNRKGETTLHVAAMYSTDTEAVRFLLNEGAREYIESVTDDGRTPLHYAAAHNSTPDMVNLLIDEGANKDAKDKEERTPLHLAVHVNRRPEIIAALVQKGANRAARDKYDKRPIDYTEDDNLKKILKATV